MEQREEGDSPASEVRIRLWDSTVKKTDTAGEGITKNNPGAGLQDREDRVFGLCCATNNCSSAR
jgi:hypothetical protein